MQEEKYNTRDRSYSAWHRRNSTRRFVGIEVAQNLAMIDLDASLYVEYDDGTKEPLALVETAIDVGQAYKTATVTKKLAERAGIPAFVLLYELADDPNPADCDFMDIKSFRAKVINWPFKEDPKSFDWVKMDPEKWCRFLVWLRLKQAKVIDGDANEQAN